MVLESVGLKLNIYYNKSHAGKVVERSWYQRSKHIFPASRWEVSFQCLKLYTLGYLTNEISSPRRYMTRIRIMEPT